MAAQETSESGGDSFVTVEGGSESSFDSFDTSGSQGSDKTLSYADNELLEMFGLRGEDFALRDNRLMRKLDRIVQAGRVEEWLGLK